MLRILVLLLVLYETTKGLQQTGQSSIYDCSGTDRSSVSVIRSQQCGQVASWP